MKLINIGFGNLVSSDKLVAVVAPDSAPVKRIVQEAKTAPVKRIVQEAKTNGLLIDATCGRKCKSVLINDSNHVVLSAVSCETIQNRAEESGEKDEQ